MKEYWDSIRSMKTALPDKSNSEPPTSLISYSDATSNDKYFPLSMHQFLNEAIRKSNNRALNRQLLKGQDTKNVKDPYPIIDYSYGQTSHQPIDTYFRMLYPSQ